MGSSKASLELSTRIDLLQRSIVGIGYPDRILLAIDYSLITTTLGGLPSEGTIGIQNALLHCGGKDQLTQNKLIANKQANDEACQSKERPIG